MVEAECLVTPKLLKEIVAGLAGREAALIGDCAEVLTEVARKRPDLVAPFASKLVPLLVPKTTCVRWWRFGSWCVSRIANKLDGVSSRDGIGVASTRGGG